jgi:hypothetical protein
MELTSALDQFEMGDYLLDADLMLSIGTAAKLIAEAEKKLMELSGIHSEFIYFGPVPIMYDTEVLGYVVMEGDSPQFYKAERKSNDSE